jgi:small-conductance mechanosensitive channel
MHHYFIESDQEHHEDVLSVRHTLVAGGYAGCVGIMGFAITLVVMATPSSIDDSKYISEGMEAHCGWSVIMMGTCSFMIGVCQVIAASHMNHHIAILFSITQLLGWNVVLGVVDTGWNVHYLGLFVFLSSNLGYHWIAANDSNYGTPRYRLLNWITIFFTVAFGSATIVVRFMETYEREAKACAMSLEFVLTFFSMLQNLFLVNGLDHFQSIHLVFEKRPF